MKKMSKIIGFILGFACLISLYSCSSEGEELNNVSRVGDPDKIVFSYKDEESSAYAEIKSGLYAFILSDKKTDYIYLLSQYNETMSPQITVNDTEQFWNTIPDKNDGRTYKQLVEEDIKNYCKRLVITKALCEKYDISVTKNEDTKAEIEQKVQNHVNAYEDENAINSYLYRFGITTDDLFEYYEMQYMVQALENYFFGESGTIKVESSLVEEKFMLDYAKVKHIYISYSEPSKNENNNSSSNSDDNVSDKEDKKESGFEFEGERTKEKVVALANELLSSFEKDEVRFDDKYALSEDNVAQYFPDGIILQKGTSEKSIDEAVFSMKTGDIKLVEGEQGAYIIMKKDLGKSDLDDYYEDIEQTFIDEKYTSLIKEYYDYVTVDSEELSKYDIVVADMYHWK